MSGGCCLACDSGGHQTFGVPRGGERASAISGAGKAVRKEVGMCQSTVYLIKGEQKEEVMREVTRLVSVESGVQLEAFFEEPRFVPGRVAQVDFLRHTVTLVPLQALGG
jgi:predicted RNA-binding protein